MTGLVLQLHGLAGPSVVRRPGGPAHRVMRFGQLTGLVSRCPYGGRLEVADAAAERVMAHHQILSLYCGEGPVLPLQFGSFFSSLHAIRERLADHEAMHLTALARLGDRQEYTLKIQPLQVVPSTAGEAALSGGAFLSMRRAARDQRKAAGARQKALGEEVLKALREMAPINAQSAASGLLTVSVLLSQDQHPAFKTLLDHHEQRLQAEGLSLKLSGPWPPYGFSTAESTAQVAHGG